MAQYSRIEWTDHTFNPWWGCTPISPGCDHCYADAWDRRLGGAHWGPHAPRRVMRDAYWRQPVALERETPPGRAAAGGCSVPQWRTSSTRRRRPASGSDCGR